MYFDGFHRSFCDDEDDLEGVQESDSIFAFETPEQFRPEQIRSQRSGTDYVEFDCPGSFSIMSNDDSFDDVRSDQILHWIGLDHSGLYYTTCKISSANMGF